MEQTPRRHQAYQYIQQRILSGALPVGAKISEQALAKEIGVSRMPVREAIRQLEVEGLVRQVPRFGTIVHTLDRSEIMELYEVREAIESHAAEAAAATIGAEDLRMLSRLCTRTIQLARELKQGTGSTLTQQQLQSFLAADMAFHMIILRACGNRRMMRIVSDLRVLAGIFTTQREPHDLKIIVSAYRYHRRILGALKKANGKLSRQWMQEHIQASRRLALESFDRRQHSGERRPPITLDLPQSLIDELTQVDPD